MPKKKGLGIRKRHRAAAKSRREANARKQEWSTYVTTQFIHCKSLKYPKKAVQSSTTNNKKQQQQTRNHIYHDLYTHNLY